MPPRKSNVSAVSATGDEGTPVKEKERDGINVEVRSLAGRKTHDGTMYRLYTQDLALPRTMVQRLAKGVLPSNTRIEKDAIAAMSKSATVFVNYLSSGYTPPSFSFPCLSFIASTTSALPPQAPEP